jgi:large subunit ribosomal protein L4
MGKLKVFNLSNKKIDEIDVLNDIFFARKRRYILSEVIHWQMSKKRIGVKSSKTKAEVSGTTKKPYPQKGRGAARQGSLKNPNQRGGGVTFAPKTRSYKYNISKKKKTIALFVAISIRNSEKSLKIIENFKIEKCKTSLVNEILNTLNLKKALIVDIDNVNLKKSVKNLRNYKYIHIDGINVYDILKYEFLLVTRKAISLIEDKFNKIYLAS